jgi:hypothetical protein
LSRPEGSRALPVRVVEEAMMQSKHTSEVPRFAVAVAAVVWLVTVASPIAAGGPRPGPALLYSPPVPAPQLQNARPWRAAPILVSGASAYRSGEFLYQDYLLDDAGADGTLRDPTDPRIGPGEPFFVGDSFSARVGTYTYPSAPDYHENAADLVEFRVKPLPHSTAFRITLNSLSDPSLVGFTIAIGDSPEPRPYPHGANVSGPAQLFVTVHGTTADVLDASTGKPIAPPPRIRVNVTRRQFDVRVPHSTWDPRRRTVRMAVGVGVWDAAAGRYGIPAQARSAAQPGGAGTLASPAAFFNVAFRSNEPLGSLIPTMPVHPNWWMERSQAEALARGDMTPFAAYVSFDDLHRKVTDDSEVPKTGWISRILASRFEFGQRIDPAADVQFVGRLQPYAIYVPRQKTPAPYGLTLYLHGCTANYQLGAGTRQVSQLASRGTGTILLSPQGRDSCGNYVGASAADAFEAWADVAQHYPLDPAFTVISGYSAGGSGAFAVVTHFPDLFAKAFPQAAGGSGARESLRNVPLLVWNPWTSEFGEGVSATFGVTQQMTSLGYRFDQYRFAPGNHENMAYNDQYDLAATWLGTAKVDPDPPHVTYVVDPTYDFPELGIVADHAYWLSGLKVRTEGSPGTVDAFSRGFGVGDATPSGLQADAGTLQGGNVPVFVYTHDFQTWGPAPEIAVENRLDIVATNVAAMTIDVVRACIECGVDLHVETDGPLTITLQGCNRTVEFGS